jgi:hypothetical protein
MNDLDKPTNQEQEQESPKANADSSFAGALRSAADALTKNGTLIGTFAVILQTVLAAIMLYSLILGRDALRVSERQLQAGSEPNLLLTPERVVHVSQDTPGLFPLVIKNASITDIQSIFVHTDCMIAVSNAPGQFQLINCGWFMMPTLPTISNLQAEAECRLTLNLTNAFADVKSLRASQYPRSECYVKVLIEYRRSVDGRPYSFSRLYLASADYELLLHDPFRGLPMAFPGLHYDEVKRLLGVP